MLQNIARKLEIFIIVAIIAAIGIIYALTKQPVTAPTQNDVNVQQAPTTTINYQGAEGKTALELLRAAHRIEIKEFSGLGEFVTAIDGIEPDASHFWAFYVNGNQAQVGAGQYVTKATNQIEWRLEEIK